MATVQSMIDAAELSSHGHAYIRFRQANWADPNDYLRLSVLQSANGGRSIGPWAHFYARRTQEAIGEKTPQQMLTIAPPFNREAFLVESYEIWTGPLDPADK
jgi:hypothetical protein